MKAALNLFHSTLKLGALLFFEVEKLEDPEEQERRHGICKANYGTCYNAEKDQCTVCTCFMGVKTGMLKSRNPKRNLRVEITHCPLAMWDDEKELEIINHYRAMDGMEPLTLNELRCQ